MAVPKSGDMNSMGRAWSLGWDLVINLVAGGLLGYGLDWLFKTGPVLMIVFGLFGLAYGMLQMIREALASNQAMTGSGPGVADADKSDE